MRQVLFYLPFVHLPVFGYGMMLFLAFVSCLFIGGWRGEKEGIAKDRVYDTAIWLVVFGFLGARTTFMIQYHVPIEQFLFVWDGGLVFYGCLIGGAVGYFGAYWTNLRKYGVSSWKMADVIASCLPLGLAFGRIGCFLNGCCYGNVACTECAAVHFPICSPARSSLVDRGLQTAACFTLADGLLPVTVDRVEPGSTAATAGLRDGDVILKANDMDMNSIHAWFRPKKDGEKSEEIYQVFDSSDDFRRGVDKQEKAGNRLRRALDPLSYYLSRDWPRGRIDIELKVRHANGAVEELPAFEPVTLGLHPTQLYETISMIFLFLLLGAFYPFRPRYGSVMALFMLCYAVHRYLNELLRNDTDPVAFGLKLSENGSILLFLGGLALAIVLWLKPSLKPGAASVKPA
jgi:phosphatidylglycerol:prolipoprotein diacylglycerol transferase